MKQTHLKIPTHELVYRQIKEMILFGEFCPGQAVTINGLVQELGVGMTPVREAIRRLTAEGALEFQGNRRIILPDLSASQLQEITYARLSIEPKLASLAAENIKPHDISRLEKIDDSLNIAIAQGDVRGYLEYNYNFHHQLYKLSEAQVLISISSMLWLRIGPSLRVVLGRFGTANLPDKHKEALAALHARDIDAVAQAINDDLEQGHMGIRMALEKDIRTVSD